MEDRIRRECRRFKEPLPKRVQNKPTLYFGLALFYNAWFELDLEREKPNRITRSMCFQYAADYDLSDEQTEDLWHYMRHMDNEFLPWWQKKQPKPKQPRGIKGGAKSGKLR